MLEHGDLLRRGHSVDLRQEQRREGVAVHPGVVVGDHAVRLDLAEDELDEQFDMANYMTPEDIDKWVREQRHKVMYRDESRVD